jgi:hypothetical protein
MDLLTINLEIEGNQYPFLVDTGASVSVIKPEIGKGQSEFHRIYGEGHNRNRFRPVGLES